jgi:hypothetical protein
MAARRSRPGRDKFTSVLDDPAGHTFIRTGIWTGIAMSDDTAREEADDPDLAASRIEAALERIARRIEQPIVAESLAELAARLDGLIERLRAALGHAGE